MQQSEEQQRLALLIETKFGGNKSLFARKMKRSRQQVFNWLSGRSTIPHWVWTQVSRISTPKK